MENLKQTALDDFNRRSDLLFVYNPDAVPRPQNRILAAIAAKNGSGGTVTAVSATAATKQQQGPAQDAAAVPKFVTLNNIGVAYRRDPPRLRRIKKYIRESAFTGAQASLQAQKKIHLPNSFFPPTESTKIR